MLRLAKKIYREGVWIIKYKWNPGCSTVLHPNISGVQEALKNTGIPFQTIQVSKEGFSKFLEACGYPASYHGGDSLIYTEKCLEHYLSFFLLDFKDSDVYIDLASDRSPFPAYVKGKTGCLVYRNDLSYPPGISREMTIGSDATRLPLPDDTITKATLHCSFEHFEGDADIKMLRELNRVLKVGGMACILPLYLHTEYVGLTDPFVDRKNLEWDSHMRPIYAKNYGQRHGRFYSVKQLQERILNNLSPLSFRLFLVENLGEIARGLWCHWVLLLEKNP